MVTFSKVRAVIVIALTTITLSGCIGSDTPIGRASDAMSLAEVAPLVAGSSLRLSAPPPGSDLADDGFLLLEQRRQHIPVRLLPTRHGIAIEFPPGAWGQPFWMYAAAIPRPGGIGLYADEFGLALAHQGRDDQPHAVAAYEQVGHLFRFVRDASGLEYMRPQNADDVVAAYIALADAGLRPQFMLNGTGG